MPERIAVVEWVDATYQRGELTTAEVKPLMRLRTVGWLLRDDKECVVLAMERGDEDGVFRHVTSIPRANVKKIKRI